MRRAVPLFLLLASCSAALHTAARVGGRRGGRAASLLRACADGDQYEEEPVDLGTELERQLRKALSKTDTSELRASDERVINSMVDDRRQALNLVEGDLADKFQAMQDELEARLDAELQSVKAETMAKIDAAVEKLRAVNAPAKAAGASYAAGSALAGLQAGDPLRATLPSDARIAVIGAECALGQQLVSTIARGVSSVGEGGGSGQWTVTALCTDVDAMAESLPTGTEARLFQPFVPTALTRSLSDASAVVICTEATCGKGGVEAKAMGRLMKAIAAVGTVQRVVVVSSHGVERTRQLPFSLSNLMGQLDRQRATEQEALLVAKKKLPGHSIVRFGKIAAASEVSSPNSQDVAVEIAPGDALSGDLPVDIAASVLIETLRRDESVNATFSVAPRSASGSTGISVYSDMGLDDEFLKLVGPEILRLPLGSLAPTEVAEWLRQWGRAFLRPGQGLTTPVQVIDVPGGVMLRFVTTGTGYDDMADESPEDKWADSNAPIIPKSGDPDGALVIVAETGPLVGSRTLAQGNGTPRLRVMRAEMAEGTLVKETSEATVLERLQRDLRALEDGRGRR